MISEQPVDLSGELQGRIACHVAGDGLPVVLVHGWGASWYLWQETMLTLAAAGYRVYAPDLIGCGQSGKPLLLYTPHDYGRYLDQFIEAQGLDRFVLVGHSLGGHVALAYALRHPERLERLVLVGPAYSPLRQLVPTRAELLLMLGGLPLLGEMGLALAPSRVLTWVFRQPWGGFYRPERLPQEFPARMAADYAAASPFVSNTIAYLVLFSLPGLSKCKRDADLMPRLGEVTVPALVVWGRHDALLRPASFADLAARLPQGQACPIAEAGHTPPLEAPQEWRRALLAFLQR